MKQQRLCTHLGLKCTHKLNFLSLTYAVRLRIYQEIGLELLTEGDIFLGRTPETDSSPSTVSSTIPSLLRSCRTIHTEISKILYSRNRFYVHSKDENSMKSVRRLSPTSLTSLRYLTVVLNLTDQHDPFLDLRASSARYRRNKPFRLSSDQHCVVLFEWYSTIELLLAGTHTSNLHLSVICDTEDPETARFVVSPLLSSDKILAECNLRLSRSPNPEIRSLASKTAAHITGNQYEASMPFRFLDLPEELRAKILEETDLLTPISEVLWRPNEGFRVTYDFDCRFAYESHPGINCSCRKLRCRQNCLTGVFCPYKFAAASSTCCCWTPPTPLFLVCRQIHKEARKVFLNRNRFIITPSDHFRTPVVRAPDRLEASVFLTKAIHLSELRFLRFIEIVFPPFEEDYFQHAEQAYQDWVETIERVRKYLNLSMLTVRVYHVNSPLWNARGGYRSQVTKEQAIKICTAYFRTVQPLGKLQGLHRFYAHLAWPYAWTERGKRRLRENAESVRQGTLKLNMKAEEIVMGKHYGRIILAEVQPHKSQWLRLAEADPYCG